MKIYFLIDTLKVSNGYFLMPGTEEGTVLPEMNSSDRPSKIICEHN